jgi:hypothetical protein
MLLRLARNVVFGVSLAFALLVCGIVFRVAAGTSFEAYPIGRVALAAVVGGTVIGVCMLLLSARRRF